ncbi:oligosaccharide repeat unit polymerase [Vibrio gazogenes]|uniref:Oligosaccharide repeat unit polymerase n=1 Tax=Vibrio gazogenes DSM 21264 = NBRC 103151 TaxID=1123492 RepID=A0A1M5D2F2_VIBGA|nr:oligosaccharide repeat unit polymerase [Vibrio gazogenes]USP13925.1 oligosaccharide repeat unit polymerase [Vibrio gazogenes]SHF61012.1 hypothetical protein SAMN02745781_02735 [Vibrio gazogenes DSM 21264] [Vibrio gazogenes DSM 21264 = NBRC 103151]SJN56670.1 hypothetical protein BQ6471_02154 [Vibrio gazogenes]
MDEIKCDLMLLTGIFLLKFSVFFSWMSRKNILWIGPIPSVLVSFFIPVIIFGNYFYSIDNVYEVYSYMIFFGGVSFLIGILLGRYIPMISFGLYPTASYISSSQYTNMLRKYVLYLLVISCVGMIISFIIMGFVPMFAADPLNAKFFRGEYHDKYMRIAILYRLSSQLIPILIPISIVLLYKKFNLILSFWVFISLIVLALTLQRVSFASGVLSALMIISAFKGRMYLVVYIFIYILIFIFGSALSAILGIGVNMTGGIDLRAILLGAPDLFDQLTFLRKFLVEKEYTYGMTFWGGLVPGAYQWNPSVYTLHVVNDGADINGLASGGLRLLSPVWGFVSFGYVGVVLVPFFSGIVSSIYVKMIRKYSNDIIKYTIMVTYYNIFIGFFINFYTMSMYSLPNMMFLFFLIYSNNLIMKKKIN